MWLTTFLLTCIAWVIFRAQNMADASYVFTHLLWRWDFHSIATEQFLMRQFPIALASIAVLEIGQRWEQLISIPSYLGRMQIGIRWALYASFVMAVIMFGVYRKAQFLYFQF